MPKRKSKTDTVVDQEQARDEDAADLKAKKADKAPLPEDDGSLEDKQWLKEHVLACKTEAETATTGIREAWQELWQIYQNVQDYSKKEDWQSKIFIPKLFMAVERASLLIKRAVLQVSKLFSMSHDEETIAPIKRTIHKARKQIRYKLEEQQELQRSGVNPERLLELQNELVVLRSALKASERDLDDKNDELAEAERKFKSHLKKTNFVSAYSEMIKPAILLGLGCIKRVLDNGRKKIRYENTDVLNLFISPDWQPFQEDPPKYIIEASDMDLSELYEMAQEVNGLQGKGQKIFDITELDKIKDESSTSIEKSEQDERRGLTTYQQVSKKVHLLQFWGKVISKDGRRSKKNQLIVLANDKYVIRSQGNPLPVAKPPYNFAIPIVYPHRGVAGISLVYAEAKLQYTLNNILNLTLDNLNWSVNKMFQFNPGELKNPRDMLRLYPGKNIPTNVNTEVVREVRVSPVGMDAFKEYEVICKEIQEGTIVTEFITAMPGQKSKTLGEVQIKTSESHGFFDVIARDLELHSIMPTLRDSYEMLCEFCEGFSGKYEFDVGGVSLLLLQRDQQEKLMQALGLAMKTPEIARRTKIYDLWKRLLDIWNQGDVFIEEDELMETEQQQESVSPLGLPGPGGGQGTTSQPLNQGPQGLVGQQQVSPQMREQIQRKAAEDARQAVSKMNPQQIYKMTGS